MYSVSQCNIIRSNYKNRSNKVEFTCPSPFWLLAINALNNGYSALLWCTTNEISDNMAGIVRIQLSLFSISKLVYSTVYLSVVNGSVQFVKGRILTHIKSFLNLYLCSFNFVRMAGIYFVRFIRLW